MKKLINFPDDLIKKIIQEQFKRKILRFNQTVITILYESINNKKKKYERGRLPDKNKVAE